MMALCVIISYETTIKHDQLQKTNGKHPWGVLSFVPYTTSRFRSLFFHCLLLLLLLQLSKSHLFKIHVKYTTLCRPWYETSVIAADEEGEYSNILFCFLIGTPVTYFIQSPSSENHCNLASRKHSVPHVYIITYPRYHAPIVTRYPVIINHGSSLPLYRCTCTCYITFVYIFFNRCLLTYRWL